MVSTWYNVYVLFDWSTYDWHNFEEDSLFWYECLISHTIEPTPLSKSYKAVTIWTNRLIRVRMCIQSIAQIGVGLWKLWKFVLINKDRSEIYIDIIYISDWYNTFNAVFFLSLGIIVCGGVGVLLSFCLKSKCSQCVVCGKDSFFLKRDVQAENEESKMELVHMPSPRRDSFIV